MLINIQYHNILQKSVNLLPFKNYCKKISGKIFSEIYWRFNLPTSASTIDDEDPSFS